MFAVLRSTGTARALRAPPTRTQVLVFNRVMQLRSHRLAAVLFLWACLAAVGVCLEPETAMAIEEPRFQTLTEDGDFSLRRYAPMIIAETEVPGSLDRASSTGFRRIAGYIFGDNRAAPDTPAAPHAAEKIAMTAPVTTVPAGTGWRVNFVMPAEYTMSTLPRPNDASVRLKELPAGSMAVIRFSGLVDVDKIAAKTALLREWMAKRHLEAAGEARLARYNPPWTLPFLRRNEILIPYR
jgi:hypothetical protein